MATLASVARRIGRAFRFGRYDHKRVFEHIFDSKYWGERESVSGMGSSMSQTESIRHELPLLLKRYDIKTLFDAPCGDLYWMRHILPGLDINYIGGDVVPEIVHAAGEQYTGSNASFRVFDIIEDPFPDADMWLCRDVLFHLSYKNIYKSLLNFSKSNIKYILVTSHTGSLVKNRNVVTGDFRQLDLFKPPFSFSNDIIQARFADYAAPANRREMILIGRDDLAKMLP